MVGTFYSLSQLFFHAIHCWCNESPWKRTHKISIIGCQIHCYWPFLNLWNIWVPIIGFSPLYSLSQLIFLWTKITWFPQAHFWSKAELYLCWFGYSDFFYWLSKFHFLAAFLGVQRPSFQIFLDNFQRQELGLCHFFTWLEPFVFLCSFHSKLCCDTVFFQRDFCWSNLESGTFKLCQKEH